MVVKFIYYAQPFYILIPRNKSSKDPNLKPDIALHHISCHLVFLHLPLLNIYLSLYPILTFIYTFTYSTYTYTQSSTSLSIMDSLFSPFKCPSSELGDYIMMESCLDHGDITESAFVRPKREKKIEKRPERAFPPPLTMLAMTENQTPHMPFVMRRYYTDDGRLVIIEERVKHHDYFKVTRTDGRLVLDLVPAHDGGEDTNNEEIDVVTEKEKIPVTEKEIDFVTEKEIDLVAEKEIDFVMENMRDFVENEIDNMGQIESLAVRSAVETVVVMGEQNATITCE